MNNQVSHKFEFVDHTGDMGVRVFGESLVALFQHAAEALYQIITDPNTIREKDSRSITVSANSLDELLISWLNEFVYLFDTNGSLFTRFEIMELEDHLVKGIAYGEAYEEGRHPIFRIIKGATYHQLHITQTKGEWRAQIIFDL